MKKIPCMLLLAFTLFSVCGCAEDETGNIPSSGVISENLSSEMLETEPTDEISISLEELEILQNPDFQETLAEALAEILPDDIIDISVTIDESDSDDRQVTAYVQTDIRTLSVSMCELSVTGSWIYYVISDAESGHVYYCPTSAQQYVDIYDYFTDELISEASE